MLRNKKMRVARPCSDLAATEKFYSEILGLVVLGNFQGHEGIDGVMLGFPDSPYHLEFTKHQHSPLVPTPTKDDLIVFYIPERAEWENTIAKIEGYGHKPVDSLNPYWDKNGKTYVDPNGYRI